MKKILAIIAMTAITAGCSMPKSNPITETTYKIKGKDICFVQKQSGKTINAVKIRCDRLDKDEYLNYDKPGDSGNLVLIGGIATFNKAMNIDHKIVHDFSGTGRFYDLREETISFWQDGKKKRELSN